MVHLASTLAVLLITTSFAKVLLFHCKNGVRIRESLVCDGYNDCGDLSDEEICFIRECDHNQFKCKSGLCISDTWVCDGEGDCPNKDDEHSCTNATCDEDSFKCDQGTCIIKQWICDGVEDCANGADEANCSIKCNIGEFQCHDDSCISNGFKCDGEYDCADGSDEINCPNFKTQFCLSTEFQCSNGLCVSISYICDGNVDCDDGSDEDDEMCGYISLCQGNEFSCDGKCIPDYKRCNHQIDCSDGSDEENCSTPRSSCNANEFDCGGYNCIPLSKKCDSKIDCPMGEDENIENCKTNECQSNNGSCSQICERGFYCKCHQGVKLMDNFTCEDVDECEDHSSCSQKCINEKGTFKCECLEGYQKDPVDHRRCKATDGEISLIFTHRRDIRILNLPKNNMTTIVRGTLSSIALDVFYQKNEIFWSDRKKKKIFKSNIHDNGKQNPIIQVVLAECDGLAIDWIYSHIYWSDTKEDTISTATLDGKIKKTLINDSLDKPRAVVVSPLDGWMFWSDWGKTPRIERAGLDGSHRISIVTYDVEWPNGLALDLVKRRLYWIDAKLDMISSANYDGSGRKVILRSTPMLQHPFSITLFEDSMYWTDWSNSAIYKSNKFNGSNIIALTKEGIIYSPMVVIVHHPYKQPNGENYCLNSKCSHFCFPAPQINEYSPKKSCACPDGLFLSSDGVNCDNKGQRQEEPHENHNSNMTSYFPIGIDEQKSNTADANHIEHAGIWSAITLLLLVVGSGVALALYWLYLRRNSGSLTLTIHYSNEKRDVSTVA